MDLENGNFNPDKKTTRETVVVALGRLQGIDPSKYYGASLGDVDGNSEVGGYINWAIENKIIAGYEDSTFRGSREITREEIARV